MPNLIALKFLYNSLFHINNKVLNGVCSPKDGALSRKLLEGLIYRVKVEPEASSIEEREKNIEERLKVASEKYKRLSNEGQGRTSSKDDIKPLKRELTEDQVRDLESKWGEKFFFERIEQVSLDIELNCGPEVERDLTKLYCTYCDAQVDETRATFGTGKPEKIKKIELQTINGYEEEIEKIIYITPKLVACPDCCLKIKKIKFPMGD